MTEPCFVDSLASAVPDPGDVPEPIASRANEDLSDRLMNQLETLQRLAGEICRVLPAPNHAQPPAEADDEICIRKEKLSELLHQLECKQTECERLQGLNESLAAEIAEKKLRHETQGDSITPSLEEMTWEQRKTLILQQLERDEAYAPHNQSRMIDIVAETERIVQDRDREIEELRELLRQQPTTTADQQVVGAASIAQILDSDQLIREERRQMQLLRHEWQEKLRQCEIEISLRRAKLARDERRLANRLTVSGSPTPI